MAVKNQIFMVCKPKLSSSYLDKYFRSPHSGHTVSQLGYKDRRVADDRFNFERADVLQRIKDMAH